jgi:hypothetical protein
MSTSGPSESPVFRALEQATVFRAFDRGEFLEWPAWRRLRPILSSNGGSYGLSGPRGAGKSWLMLRAIDEVRDPDVETPGIGLWYPSPSEYNPLAFLASLSDGLANEIERRFRKEHPVRDALSSNPAFLAGVSGLVGLLLYLYLSLYGFGGNSVTTAIVSIGAGVIAALLLRSPTLVVSRAARGGIAP